MNDAEINNIVANFIANNCNGLMEKARPFPSEKLEDVQSAVYETMQNLGNLYRALEDYRKGNEESLLKIK